MSEDNPPLFAQCVKSSMEILSELFGTFDAEPPVIVKKEKSNESKKHKKSKKKHKHKSKKSKKKEKKHKLSDDEKKAVDLADLLIKEERKSPERKINFEEIDVKLEPNIKPAEIVVTTERQNASDVKEEAQEKRESKSKITIKDLKSTSINVKVRNDEVEEGQISDASSANDNRSQAKEKRKRKRHSPEKHHRKTRRHSHSEEKDKYSSKSRERVKSRSPLTRERKHSSEQKKEKDRRHRRDVSRDDDDFYGRRDSKDRGREYKSKQKTYDDHKGRYRDERRHKDHSPRSFRDYSGRWGYSDVIRDKPRRSRERSRHKDDDDYIDKKKLLEIARRNAILMMKSGSLPAALTLGPQAQEKVLAAIKAGGKTIEELTDFCKTLSRKEELGELSSVSDEDGEDNVHHPFQLKDRSSLDLIKNRCQVIKPIQESTTTLTSQFPVSSGTFHRITEGEVEEEPEKPENMLALVPLPSVGAVPMPVPAPTPVTALVPLPVAAPVPQPVPAPVTEPAKKKKSADIGSIVSERLMAIRALQENPASEEALGQMQRLQEKMQTWVESKQQPGQFTGSTGAQILSQAQLASGYQAWAKKDQLQKAAPIMGGMGMHLLKKMGWNPGEGLGKEKSGTLEPLQLEVKLDKKGLLANEEGKSKGPKAPKKVARISHTLEDKHPVSLLGEYASKRKLGPPLYELCYESGPDHKKMFLFKVVLNGFEYTPSVARLNKKQAKAEAARLCLEQMGLVAPTAPMPQ